MYLLQEGLVCSIVLSGTSMRPPGDIRTGVRLPGTLPATTGRPVIDGDQQRIAVRMAQISRPVILGFVLVFPRGRGVGSAYCRGWNRRILCHC